MTRALRQCLFGKCIPFPGRATAFGAVSARRRSSCALSSRVNRSPKSSRLVHLANLNLGLAISGIGAAFDPFDRLFFRVHLEHPEPGDQILASMKGPSITVRFVPENLTRAPFELG